MSVNTVTFQHVKKSIALQKSDMGKYCQIIDNCLHVWPDEWGVHYCPDDFIESAYVDKLDWQKRGLRQTASGYGKKLTTQYKIKCADGVRRRVYLIQYGNAGSSYILVDGVQLFLKDNQL